MSATWTPTNATPLIEAQEDETSVSAQITVTPEAPALLSGLAWEASPALPPQAVVTVSGDTLQVFFPDFDGMWPIEVQYLLDTVPGAVTDWAELPEAAEDVYAYRKEPSGMRVFELVVTASFDTAPDEVQAYQIVLFPNYTPGRDALVGAVDARRHAIG